MIERRLRFGVVGAAGWVAQARHLPVLRGHPGADVIAIYDRALDRAKAIGAPGERVLATVDELLELELDAVSICTPPWLHARVAVQAMESGINVFCEKPMATSVSDGELMLEAASRAGAVLTISHNFLWSSAMQRARSRFGGSGTVRHVSGLQLSADTRRLPTWVDQLEGGLLEDEIPHLLYVADSLLGGGLSVSQVRATWNGRHSEPASCDIWLDAKNGTGRLALVIGAPLSEWHILAVADHTVVDIDLFRNVAVSTGRDGEHRAQNVLATSGRVAAQHFAGFARAGLSLARRKQYWGHDALIDAFITAVRSEGPSPVPPEDALRILRCSDVIINAISATRA